MPGWTCPDCGRLFRRRGQTHECAPAMPLAEYFATGPAHERPIFEAVMDRLGPVGPVHVEPVSVGLFLKRAQTFAELRPRDRWVNLSFRLPYRARDPRIRSTVPLGSGGAYHVVRLRDPADVDDQVAAWLIDAYLGSPE